MAMTLSGSNGITFNDASTQSTGKQACKAWVNFNGVTTATIRDSFNVSSVTRNSTGQYSINYTTAMANANYSMIASAAPVFGTNACYVTVFDNNSSNAYQATTTAGSILCRNAGNQQPNDSVGIAVAIFSS